MSDREGARQVVRLFTLPRGRDCPHISQPCMKAELFLRLHKIPYELKVSSRPGPEGRWPWIEHNGNTICDSRRIIAYLQRCFLGSADAEALTLSEAQLALGTMLRRLCEDSMYFFMLRHVLVDHVAWGP